MQLSRIFVYPIKSLGGVELASADVTDRGLKYDRRWMLIDNNCAFITQREYPQMAVLKARLGENYITVSDGYSNNSNLVIPYEGFDNGQVKVSIWNAVCDALQTSEFIDQWFSDILKIKCRLVYMPDESMRPVDTTSGYAPTGKFTSFADAYPFLMLGQESVNDLNTRLEAPVSITRFRPNLVFSGGQPYIEDHIEEFEINGVKFLGLENCARCSIITINQENAEIDKAPLKALSTYRKNGNNVFFGRNVVHSGTGKISIGDEIILAKDHH